MTDTIKDVVDRLRTENALVGHYGPPALQIEAADLIERLSAALEFIAEFSTCGESSERARSALGEKP